MHGILKRIELGEQIDMPAISLYLQDKSYVITGYLVDMIHEGREKHLVVELEEEGQRSGRMFFCELSFVKAETIQQFGLIAHVLYDIGVFTGLNLHRQLTKQSLQYQLEEEMETLKSFVITLQEYRLIGDLPDEPKHLFLISNMLTDVNICLRELSFNRGPLDMLEAIWFIFDPKMRGYSFDMSGGRLSIQGGFSSSFTTSLRRRELLEKLDGLL
jgi:hypothetical protein